MESVQARQRGASDFEGYYKQLCALQDTCPLTSVKSHLAEGVLDLNGDRIRAPDWAPILNAVRINKSLWFVAVRSYFQQAPVSDDCKDGKVRSRVKRRSPPVRSKDVTYRLCVALKEVMSVSQALTHTELQGIPLRVKDVHLLAKGIAKNRQLQHLSMETCRVGDRGVETLCQGIKNSPSVTSLNFSGCGLTSRGAEALAKLVKHQSTQRHSEAWKDSLRYRRPDLDHMAGIRRITLNQNPLVNDDGAGAFAEALKDDLWLKALDMQQCGISNLGAKVLLDSLHQNSSIVVLDIRKNHLVDRDLLKAVMEQVLINAGGAEHEYKWLRPTGSSREQGSKGRRRTKTLNSSFGRKTTIRVSSAPSSAPPRSRGRASGDAVSGRVARVMEEAEAAVPAVTRPGPGFVPWRTAARASQRRVHPEEHQVLVESSPGSTPSQSARSLHVHATSGLSSGDMDTSYKDTGTPGTLMSSTREELEEERNIDEQRMRREMQVELEELHRRLYIESRARAAADAHVVELQVANSRLRHQVQLLQARSPASPLRARPAGQPAPSAAEALEDEGILDSIEESFAKFHRFLDLLRDAGLGQLCTLVGTSPEEIRNPHVKSILQKHQPTPYLHHPSGTGSSHQRSQDNRGPPEPHGRHQPADETPGGVISAGAQGGPTGGPSTNLSADGENKDARQVYMHAPLVSGRGQDGPSPPDSGSVRSGELPAAGAAVTADPRPVVVHPPLSEPQALNGHLPAGDPVTTDGRQQQGRMRSDADLTRQHRLDFEQELEKPHIEITSQSAGMPETAEKHSPADAPEDRADARDTKERPQSDQEHWSHSDGHSHSHSHSHSHRTSTPTRSRDTPPGSENPSAATYSLDEDHDESLDFPGPGDLEGSDEDLFMDLPSPSRKADRDTSNQDPKEDDDYSSDEDFE